ncbi:MAG: selenocysteine-specific translation elongation factor, partial [Planctomycetota bacterium]
MGAVQTNITLGTAGHIDHGKTALIKCLTGCDTDRLKAEKERGMSIDLGFAPCRISSGPSDMEIGIVDVPGHENFVKKMVAGANGIDGVIFVIAADDGVMPQTREHLDILTLLGVKYGIVTLTKADCVEPDRLQRVTAEIKEFLVGTFLQAAVIAPISSITGQGFDVFLDGLKNLVSNIKPKSTDGIFRLPVERTFSVKGYGTVVTGIPVSGSAKIGDEVVLFPHGIKSRIKAIQVYKRDSNTVMTGQCAAINAPNWDYKTIKRGNVVTMGEYFSPQQWYLCKLYVLASAGLQLKSGTGIKFHTGTSEVPATLYLLEGSTVAAGQQCLVQVKLSEQIVAAPGDHFILRSLSPVRTVGGGMIIESLPGKLKRSRPEVIQNAQAGANAVSVEEDFVEYCVKTAENFAASETELSLRAKILSEPLAKILAELVGEDKVLKLSSKKYIHCDSFAHIQQRLVEIIADFHRSRPESPGITIKQFCETSQLQKDVFDGVVKLLLSRGEFIERKQCIALPEHREEFNEEEQKLIEAVETLFTAQLFNPPKFEEVVEKTETASDKVQKILRILIEQKRLIEIERNLLFHDDAVEQARGILISFINEHGRLESVKFKYLLDTTRKFALPLLDYFDRI